MKVRLRRREKYQHFLTRHRSGKFPRLKAPGELPMSTRPDSLRSISDIRVLRTVILLRLGQQDGSVPGDFGGLTETGFRQAALAAERLSMEPIDRIVSSGLPRAKQTAHRLPDTVHPSRSKPTQTEGEFLDPNTEPVVEPRRV